MELLGLLGTRRLGMGSWCALLEGFKVLHLWIVLRFHCGPKNCSSPAHDLSLVVAPAKVRVRCLVFCCALADGSGPLTVPRRLCLIQVGRLAILAGFLTLWIFLIQARVAVAHFWRWWVMIVSSRPVAARLPVWCAVRPPSAPLGLTL